MGEVTPIQRQQPGPPTSAPAPLNSKHDLSRFDCGKPALNDWLRTHAMASEAKSARTFVICENNVVVGYYCIAAGSIAREETPKKIRHGLPSSVPIMLVGRLAVDKQCQGRGLGKALLKDALLRILNASKDIGARAVLVHAIDDDAVVFYSGFGFKPFPLESRTLFLPLETITAGL